MWKFDPAATYNTCGGSRLTRQRGASAQPPPPYLPGHSRYVHSLQGLLIRIRKECAANSTGHAHCLNDRTARDGRASLDDRHGLGDHCVPTDPVNPVGRDLSLRVRFDRPGRGPRSHCDPHGRADPHGRPVLSVLARLASAGDRGEYLARAVSTSAQDPPVRQGDTSDTSLPQQSPPHLLEAAMGRFGQAAAVFFPFSRPRT